MSIRRRYATPEQVAAAAADQIVELAAAAIDDHGRFSLVLSGGSTPRQLYALLATAPYATQIDWPNVHLFWGDERCVPPDHEQSNYRMVRETLLDQIHVGHVYPIQGDIDPAQAAAEYEQQLRVFFSDQPRFDLVLLGMGDDGHTASLFPGTAAIHEQTRWVIAHFVEKLNTWRITLTPPVINTATQVLFLVTGQNKAAPLDAVLNGPYQPDHLPSQIIQSPNVCWLVDDAAASKLEE